MSRQAEGGILLGVHRQLTGTGRPSGVWLWPFNIVTDPFIVFIECLGIVKRSPQCWLQDFIFASCGG